MNAAKWIAAIVLVLASLGFAAFVILANNFRSSFGASQNSLLIAAIPVIASIAFAIWLLSGTKP